MFLSRVTPDIRMHTTSSDSEGVRGGLVRVLSISLHLLVLGKSVLMMYGCRWGM